VRRENRTSIAQKLNNILYFLAGAMVTVLIGFIVIGVQVKNGELEAAEQQKARTAAESPAAVEETEAVLADTETGSADTEAVAMDTTVEKWQEGTISYNGKYYRYNNHLKTYLFMGIDTDDEVYNMITKDTGYQSDALFLMVANTQDQTLSVVTINRNTMTEIERFTGNGTSMGKDVSQICVQHAYGDGRKLSCSRVVDAVENLFYNIPVQGYVSLNMGAIPGMNDAVGGVRVTVLDDLNYEDRGVNLKKGEEVTLNGQEAYCYLRGRDVNDFDSASERLRRQEQYITSFILGVQGITDQETTVVNMYNAVEPYTVTDIDFENLLTELLEYTYTENDIYTVPGEATEGSDGREEYNVDADALYDLVIQVFYNEVEA
jgi:LCP family protein required for cell wall assembly